jgi:undecaprenyl phosphate-alpha-L-ara4FN deformylase
MTYPPGAAPRVALKVDCDSYEGTRRGVPNLLRLFDRLGIRASFFFTLGPDRSGVAVRRVLTRKGFLRKMLRSRALTMYPPRTLLYGTLLPAPRIGSRLAAELRSVAAAGHEVGVHAWDHVHWHDRLAQMDEAEVVEHYGRAHEEFAAIFGHKATASAAPGWQATAVSLAVQERYDLLYASDTRGGPPFFPEVDGRRFRTLEIPTTLPTWDETINGRGSPQVEALLHYYTDAVRGTEVHSIHTEVEGTSWLEPFDRQLRLWQGRGFQFITLEQIARESLASADRISGREIAFGELPGRAGQVAIGISAGHESSAAADERG